MQGSPAGEGLPRPPALAGRVGLSGDHLGARAWASTWGMERMEWEWELEGRCWTRHESDRWEVCRVWRGRARERARSGIAPPPIPTAERRETLKRGLYLRGKGEFICGHMEGAALGRSEWGCSVGS